MEHDDVESNEISVSSSKRRRKTTSVVWDFYEKLPLDTDPDNRLRAKYKKCGIIFLADSKAGMTNLKRHLAKHNIEASKQGCLVEHFKLMDLLLCDGDFVHIRCANHILNLIVKAACDDSEEEDIAIDAEKIAATLSKSLNPG